MPRTRALSSYPREYWQMIEGCALRKETYELQLTNIKAALALQGQFYAFRGALKRAQDKAHIRGQAAEAALLDGQINMAETTVCWIDKSGPPDGPVRVRFIHRDNTPQAALLREFLASAAPGEPIVTTEAEVSASERELLEKLNDPLKKGYR